MTKITPYNVQRAITPNVGKSQLWFLCSASCLIVVNISEKFQKQISETVFKLWGGLDFVADRQTSMAKTV